MQPSEGAVQFLAVQRSSALELTKSEPVASAEGIEYQSLVVQRSGSRDRLNGKGRRGGAEAGIAAEKVGGRSARMTYGDLASFPRVGYGVTATAMVCDMDLRGN